MGVYRATNVLELSILKGYKDHRFATQYLATYLNVHKSVTK